jgi:hypothetical protein
MAGDWMGLGSCSNIRSRKSSRGKRSVCSGRSRIGRSRKSIDSSNYSIQEVEDGERVAEEK